MNHLKSFRLFESRYQSNLAESGFKLENPEAVNIVEDWKSEFTDLGYKVSEFRFERVMTKEYFPQPLSPTVNSLIFEISSDHWTTMIDDCYEPLKNLRKTLQSECNLDLRIEVGDYDYDLDLEDCIDLHGGLEQMVLFIIVL
jgi:hypothetical protein